ncbi:MAG: hypothetical protein IID41_10530 [Planctomycetes bacterium]|nr:hypothetical protein [Planctomycetota bacterium]
MLTDYSEMPDGPLDAENLRRFFLFYISHNGTAVNMRQAAGKYYEASPSTISRHVNELRTMLRPRADNLWRSSGGARVKGGPVTCEQILERLEWFAEEFGTVWGIKSDTAKHFNITVSAVAFHLQKLLADPVTAERAKRFTHKPGMNIEGAEDLGEN